MRFSSTAFASVASYTSMSDTTIPPASPTPVDQSKGKKFEGDGISFKGKLIGMEDLSIDRDEKVCLDSMFKLKAVVRARGDHKQKIQFNLTMNAVKIIDDTTKAQVASHEIERISFVVVDPRDSRAFGYIFNTTDDRHQFWAIKTEKPAGPTVLALKELFDVVFEQFAKAEKAKLEPKKPTTPVSPTTELVPAKEPLTDLLDTPLTAPVAVPVVTTTTPLILDIGLGIDNSTTTTTNTITGNLLDVDATPIPVVQPTPKTVDPLEDFFRALSTMEVPAPINTTNPTVNFPPNPMPQPSNPYANFSSSSTAATNPFSATPTVSQQATFPQRIPPPPPATQDFLAPRSLSPSVTNPFSGFDLLGDLSNGTSTRPTKESFFPTGPPAKTIQQLQMEKQLYPFNRS